ncbi:FGGY-family carbohydrate kinase [Poseidonocella sp. HB161398]|uniref:FGGY-family carbohydrate kinase n=1 Tax=Poseidonocella sp. HB161398 TaxID=2320855 RepID=UPI00110874F7|nr:FGGY-family carbohydrate kinase [Poseidonocella sp. HB161398]
MSADILIGVDAGTSVIKAVAFGLDGRELAVASRRNSYATLPDGGVEQDMLRTWEDTAAVLREVAAQVGPDRVLALGVTGQGDGTWLVDAAGRPVHDGWLWLDARAAAEARDLAQLPGIGAVYRICGSGVNVCQMRTHLLWMTRHAPQLLERAATALHCKDWLYYRLTGVLATDPTEGVFTFGDYRSRDYSEEVIEALGLSPLRRLLPPILDGSKEAHALSPAAAAATGLPAGLPVSLGYVDIMTSAMGAGLHDAAARPGFTILGSTGVHMRFAADQSEVALNADRTGYTMPFPGPAYAQLQTNMAATLNIDWLLGLGCQILAAEGVARSPADLLRSLDGHVMAARPGAALFHPYISAAGERGPFTEPAARASFTGLDQSTGWFDLVRAVYDGLALAARDCYAAMGPLPGEIRLTGGAARSGALRLILASALERPVRTVARAEAGAAGAVMIAGIAQGVFADAGEANDRWVRPLLEPATAPDAGLARTYDKLFEGYRETRAAMAPAWERQAQMRAGLAAAPLPETVPQEIMA